MDPTLVEGYREVRLDAYRTLRDHLLERLRSRFPPTAALSWRARYPHQARCFTACRAECYLNVMDAVRSHKYQIGE